MARYEREAEWTQWAGSLETLRDVAELALRTLAPTDYGGEPADPVISVQIRDFTATLDSLGDLASPAIQRDLADIKGVTIQIGRSYGSPGMHLRASPEQPALSVKLIDDDQNRFEGLSRQIRDILQPRSRLGFSVLRSGFEAVFITGAFWIFYFCVYVPLHYTTTVGKPVVVSVAAGAGVAGAALVWLLRLASPTFELLEPDAKPKFQRWRGRLIGGLVTVFLGVVGSVLATVLVS